MKTYHGVRHGAHATVTVHDPDRCPLALALYARDDLRPFHPFAWGWGSQPRGSSRLALALLADATGDDQVALDLYPAFAGQVLAHLPDHQWELPQVAVLAWVGPIRFPRGLREGP